MLFFSGHLTTLRNGVFHWKVVHCSKNLSFKNLECHLKLWDVQFSILRKKFWHKSFLSPSPANKCASLGKGLKGTEKKVLHVKSRYETERGAKIRVPPLCFRKFCPKKVFLWRTSYTSLIADKMELHFELPSSERKMQSTCRKQKIFQLNCKIPCILGA